MATSILFTAHLEAMALAINATHRALTPSTKAQQWLLDQTEALEAMAAERREWEMTDDDVRRQWEENELEQISNDMNARGEQ